MLQNPNKKKNYVVKKRQYSKGPNLYKSRPAQYQKQVIEYDLTWKQNYLYKKAILGMEGVPVDIVPKLSPEQVKEIIREHNRVQRFLNEWKQEICSIKSNNLLEKLFPNSRFVKQLVTDYSKPHCKFTNTLSFKDLGVNKEMIIDKLIEKEFLPGNFYELA